MHDPSNLEILVWIGEVSHSMNLKILLNDPSFGKCSVISISIHVLLRYYVRIA